jgi:hypothetical protein
LKVMTREGHERRSKHCEAAGASSLSWAPDAQPKQLAKRSWPNSLHEDSCPEDYPPHGATPSSPDGFECLKMRSPIVHTNREVVNYNKVDPSNIVMLRENACYNKSKERGTDECFWTFFQQDWYHIVPYRKPRLVVPMQWVHIDYMRKKKGATFNKILEACDFHGISNLLQFRYNQNQEIITEFYSTLFFKKKERIFMWITNGRRFSIKLTQFAELLGLSSHLNNPKKLHTG